MSFEKDRLQRDRTNPEKSPEYPKKLVPNTAKELGRIALKGATKK